MTAGTDDFQVASEVGRLRRVILHRPGLELTRLTPANCHALLFDDVLWASRAREEHDAFAAALRAQGVDVLYYGQLLGEALEVPEAREWAIRRILNEETVGPSLVTPLSDLSHEVDGATLARYWIGGVVREDITNHPGGLLWSVLADDEFVLAPLPNTLFTRDNSAWLYGGVSLSPMSKPARHRETVHTSVIYRWHPLFADSYGRADGFQVWLDGTESAGGPATLEGGDILVVDPRTVLVGVSERSTAQAVEVLAARLLAADAVDRVIAVELPRSRAFMHLDTVMTMVDHDAFVAYPGLFESVRSYTITVATPTGEPTGSGALQVRANDTLQEALADALGVDRLRVLTADMDARAAAREQWDDGNNFLALAPGVVVGYERNERTNAMLTAAGIDVVAVAGSELGRGRGGPRCMSCPVSRQPVAPATGR
jgi:arginine deiminase